MKEGSLSCITVGECLIPNIEPSFPPLGRKLLKSVLWPVWTTQALQGQFRLRFGILTVCSRYGHDPGK